MKAAPGSILRADLHVHSCHSGYAGRRNALRALDCYSEPDRVYATAKRRGMDLVTITDHDSIDGCLEFLEHHPGADDFFISEEIECEFPNRRLRVHVGAYGIDERIHREIQPLRPNVFEAAAYLRSEGVAYALNHPFFYLTGQLSLEAYLRAAVECFPAFEGRNGAMLRDHNQLVEAMVAEWTRASGIALGVFGGSDAHTLRRIGRTFTEAPATDCDEFLQSLRAGRARIGGRHGGMFCEAAEIYGVIGRYFASLVGIGRQQLSWPRRAFGLGFSLISMPFEFIPLAVAALDKRGEARRVARYREEWEGLPDAGGRIESVPVS